MNCTRNARTSTARWTARAANCAMKNASWKNAKSPLEQKRQLQVREKRELDHKERKIKERREQLEKRGQELDGLLTQQTQKLHEISTLNRDQAEKLLLERLEKEL